MQQWEKAMSDTPARYSEDICGELYQCPEGEYIFYEYYEESQKELAAKTAECAELRFALKYIAEQSNSVHMAAMANTTLLRLEKPE
jgi:hypothetical protein